MPKRRRKRKSAKNLLSWRKLTCEITMCSYKFMHRKLSITLIVASYCYILSFIIFQCHISKSERVRNGNKKLSRHHIHSYYHWIKCKKHELYVGTRKGNTRCRRNAHTKIKIRSEDEKLKWNRNCTDTINWFNKSI